MITVFTCENNLSGMLTCIYEASSSRIGHAGLRLAVEPLDQLSLFEDYRHVETDDSKVRLVIDAICRKISPGFYRKIAYASGAYEPDTLDVMYRVILLGFHYGPDVLKMYQYRDVVRFLEISRRYERESESFLEFVRFHSCGDIYVSHIEPKSRILIPLADYFSDRMPSENWIIVDDIHLEAIIHPSGEQFYLRYLSEDESLALQKTEAANDCYTDYWKTYFNSIAIKERSNPGCQLTHFPKWKRKHVVEFM